VVSPPSHCPHCKYSIPWFLNIPLFTWLFLRGKCQNCGAPIAARYFLVELLTAVLFLCAWLSFGRLSLLLTLAYCLVLAGFIAATFIDFEHFIIPDEITLGGIAAGFLCSFFIPELHGWFDRRGNFVEPNQMESLKQSLIGIGVGWGLVAGIRHLGKMLFGRQSFKFDTPSQIRFTDAALELPDQTVTYDDLFSRKSDTIEFMASRLELPDRCFWNVPVRMSPEKLAIGEENFNPEEIAEMTATTEALVLPREAMGYGDVKFMAAIGAFLGWEGVLFSLMASSIIGSVVGIALILFRKQEWSTRIPYGPYIAVAATIWIFGGHQLVSYWLGPSL
jgi:leader peptidase (prepilin peptidase)/N-methyltransferase